MNGKTNSVVLAIGFLGFVFGLVGMILPSFEPSEAWQTDAPFKRRHMYYPMGADNDVRIIGAGTSDLKAFYWYLVPQTTQMNTGRWYNLNIPEDPWANNESVREFEVAVGVRDLRTLGTAGFCFGDAEGLLATPIRADANGELCGFWFESDGGANPPCSVWTETQDGAETQQTDVATFPDNARRVCRIEQDMPNNEIRYYIDNVLVNTDTAYNWSGSGAISGRLSLYSETAITSSFSFFQVWYHSDYF